MVMLQQRRYAGIEKKRFVKSKNAGKQSGPDG